MQGSSAHHLSQRKRMCRVHARLSGPHLGQDVMLVGRQGKRDRAAQGHGGEEDAAPPGQARGGVHPKQHLLRTMHRRRRGKGLVPAARASRANGRD